MKDEYIYDMNCPPTKIANIMIEEHGIENALRYAKSIGFDMAKHGEIEAFDFMVNVVDAITAITN